MNRIKKYSPFHRVPLLEKRDLNSHRVLLKNYRLYNSLRCQVKMESMSGEWKDRSEILAPLPVAHEHRVAAWD